MLQLLDFMQFIFLHPSRNRHSILIYVKTGETKLCEKIRELNGINTPLDSTTLETLRKNNDMHQAAASSLGYFGMCAACEGTLMLNVGEKLTEHLPPSCVLQYLDTRKPRRNI